MSVALARAAEQIDIPELKGVSLRAVRVVLSRMAYKAQSDGSFRWGMRGSKVSEIAGYSLSVVRRAQRVLLAHGLIEQVRKGGGRASTLWRIVVDKLLPPVDNASSETRQPAQADTPPVPSRHSSGARGKWFSKMLGARLTGDSSPDVSDTTLCEHGHPAGLQSTGRPRCPHCRHLAGARAGTSKGA